MPFHSYKLSFEIPEIEPHIIINGIDIYEIPEETFFLIKIKH